MQRWTLQLESFSVAGFRSLADVRDIELHQVSVLTGRNDSGKTAMITALAFLLNGYEVTDDDYAVIPDVEPGITVTGAFLLDEAERAELNLPQRTRVRRRVAQYERAVYEVEKLVPVDASLRDLENASLPQLKHAANRHGVSPTGPATSKESFLSILRPLADSAPRLWAWASADGDVVRHLPVHVQMSGAEMMDAVGPLREALKASYQQLLRSEDFTQRVAELQGAIEVALAAEADELCQFIEDNCDGYSAVSIRPSVAFRNALSDVKVVATRDGRQVSFEQVGSGQRRLLTLAIWDWSNSQVAGSGGTYHSAVITYDEPDAHLDYLRQRQFMERVRNRHTTPGIRVVVATHSAQMIDQVPLEDIIHLKQENGWTTCRCLPGAKVDMEGGAFVGDMCTELGLATSAVLFERCFLLVEGESERCAFPRLFQLVTGRRMTEVGIVIFSAEGRGNVPAFLRQLRDMGKTVHVLVDRDCVRDQPKVFQQDKLIAHHVDTDRIDYIGNPNELEELFADEQWAAIAENHWPRTDGRLWSADDITAIRAGGKFSDRLKALLYQASGCSAGKPEMMNRLTASLRHADEVPLELQRLFKRMAA